MLLSQFPLTFLQTQKGSPLLILELMTILMLVGMVFVIIIRCDDIFELCASARAVGFCQCFQCFHVYIPHRKYQVKPHSAPCFYLLVLLP